MKTINPTLQSICEQIRIEIHLKTHTVRICSCNARKKLSLIFVYAEHNEPTVTAVSFVAVGFVTVHFL